jgi:phage protein D
VSLVRPNAVITLDGQRYSAAEAAVVRLRASLSVRGSHDCVAIRAWPSSKLAKAKVGSALSVALGDAGAETDVWSGEVVGIETAPEALTINGLAATVALSRTRTSQTYADHSVADIVRDLAGSVDVDEIDADLNLPSYTVDDRRPVWGHLVDLAALADAELGANAAGALRFVPVRTGSADMNLRHGADVLAWNLSAGSSADAPSVASYGAASEAGAAQWHWMLSTPAPQGTGAFLRIVPAIRTRDAAQAAARALAARAARAQSRGRLALVGRAALRPGNLVAVADLPAGDPGTLRVIALDHVLHARAGFTTAAVVQGAGS